MKDLNEGITIGEMFPDIEVQTTQGPMRLPEDYEGKWFVLFSHPGDFTPVCTTEFISFQQYQEDFNNMGTELIGLSIDQVYAHLKWIEWIQENTGVSITFPIIADPLGALAKKLGMLPSEQNTRTIRAVFIVDDKGIIRMVLYYPQEIGRNVQEIWRSVHALQTSDLFNVVLPENWPNNPLIGSNVIVPPANSVEEIQKRLDLQKQGKIECLDWWFCYKPLKME
ncbi:peroxiredoxin [Pontibacillus yanchengensis]|uniref:Peroxiredoxin n=1 Tax=Pontibacillus yanchengensis Y32 TaxID=1385514 RepID=A0A0A2T799_9BACI|nr:peroxiredoxin [Pontibacillus yanchengensis]KGP71349.1 peroxiredoxin [Pontibacillus yanchengensis Y32]